MFSFGHFSKLYFERRWFGTESHHIESRNALHFRVEPRLLPARSTPCMFEAFVFGNSSFALTLLALFGKIEIREIIYRGNFTRQEDHWQKNPLVLGNFNLFPTSGRPLSSSTDIHCIVFPFHTISIFFYLWPNQT